MSISLTQPGDLDVFDILLPSPDLLHKYKNNEISWYNFKTEYKSILEEKKEEIIEILSDVDGDVTFCCWERDPYHCHRYVAYEFLKAIGYKVTLK